MKAFVEKINSRLILGVFAKVAEFLGNMKKFSMHIYMYLIRCRKCDFCLEMKSVFDKNELFVYFWLFLSSKNRLDFNRPIARGQKNRSSTHLR